MSGREWAHRALKPVEPANLVKYGHQPGASDVVAALFQALSDPAGVTAARAGALERVQFLLADLEPHPPPNQPDHTPPGQPQISYAGTDDGPGHPT